MKIPERVNGKWISGLDNPDLIEAEARLHADFQRQDKAEKVRRGVEYRLLEGPATLMDAWLRWTLASNETKKRGLTTSHLT